MKTCSFVGCGREHFAHGHCQQHDRQAKRGETLRPIKTYRRNKGLTCYLAGCDRSARGLGLCDGHLARYSWARRTGTVMTGWWKEQFLRRSRVPTVQVTARWPKSQLEALRRYAEFRGLPMATAMVEVAVRALAERGGRRAA